jgi:hypothetical protein
MLWIFDGASLGGDGGASSMTAAELERVDERAHRLILSWGMERRIPIMVGNWAARWSLVIVYQMIG